MSQGARPAVRPSLANAPLRRSRPESRFGQILAGLLSAHPQVESAAFVDAYGECIDYASRLDPFEAEVAGAQLLTLQSELAERLGRLGAGALVLWTIEAEQRDFIVRRVTEDHCAVIALSAAGLSAHLLRSMAALAEALRREGGLDAPHWDAGSGPFQVLVRPSAGFGYAPDALVEDGRLTKVEVLGRWTERGLISAEEVVCFRVRSDDRELTLAHDRSLDRWQRR